MNIREAVELLSKAAESTGYLRDTTREGTAPAPGKLFRVVVEGFNNAEAIMSDDVLASKANVSIILSKAEFGGRAEDATIALAEEAEQMIFSILTWISDNNQDELAASWLEARVYLGENRTIKISITFELSYQYQLPIN